MKQSVTYKYDEKRDVLLAGEIDVSRDEPTVHPI